MSPIPTIKKPCAHCRRTFTARSPRAKYCTDKCRVAAHRRRPAKKATATLEATSGPAPSVLEEPPAKKTSGKPTGKAAGEAGAGSPDRPRLTVVGGKNDKSTDQGLGQGGEQLPAGIQAEAAEPDAGAQEPASLPVVLGALLSQVAADLTKMGAIDTTPGRAALALAYRIEAPQESGSAAATMSRELSRLMAEAEAVVTGRGAPDSIGRVEAKVAEMLGR